MGRRVKASDVLDPNVVTRTDIEAEVIGRFVSTGPNKWDDYELEREASGVVATVPAGSPIQLEPLGADPEIRFRYRQERTVQLLKWVPSDEDAQRLSTGRWGERESEKATFFERVFGTGPADDPRDDYLEYFLDVFTVPYESEPGVGVTAFLVRKLRGG